MRRLHIVIFFTLATFSLQVLSAINMQDITFSELPGSRVEIRASFSGQPSIPTGYSIEQPARIVLDLPGVISVLPQKKYSLGLGNVKSTVVLTAKERTRMILNLSNVVNYSAEVENNDLVIIVYPWAPRQMECSWVSFWGHRASR